MTDQKNVETQAYLKYHIRQINEKGMFYNFSTFLTEHWLEPDDLKDYRSLINAEQSTEDQEQTMYREKAYKRCYNVVRSTGVVSRPTLRQWFGLGKTDKNTRPRRGQLIEFAFAAQLSEQQLQEYLVDGLLEPGIQYNDYTEVIYQYGLHNQLSYSECSNMIVLFEREVNKQNVIAQTTHTEELVREYRRHQEVPKEEFLIWMFEIASYFKGYSKVALNRFESLKHEILLHVRKQARNSLDRYLDEVDYPAWERKHRKEDETDPQSIMRFIHNVTRQKNNNDSTLYKSIANIVLFIYNPKDRNSDLLEELYAAAVDEEEQSQNRKHRFHSRKRYELPESLCFMTDKYLSQLLSIADNKEKEIRLSQAVHCLENEQPQAPCPDWIYDSLRKCGFALEATTVADALQEISKEFKKQKQACRYIRRSDLLQLIHYVAQLRYDKICAEDGEYRQQDALVQFENLANDVFSECHMAPLDPKYQLDAMYLTTFGDRDMYSLSEVIEAMDSERY